MGPFLLAVVAPIACVVLAIMFRVFSHTHRVKREDYVVGFDLLFAAGGYQIPFLVAPGRVGLAQLMLVSTVACALATAFVIRAWGQEPERPRRVDDPSGPSAADHSALRMTRCSVALSVLFGLFYLFMTFLLLENAPELYHVLR